MSNNIISDLTISIAPNGKPKWSGNIKGALFNPKSKLINYTAPIGSYCDRNEASGRAEISRV